jgi:hypothetical protein
VAPPRAIAEAEIMDGPDKPGHDVFNIVVLNEVIESSA